MGLNLSLFTFLLIACVQKGERSVYILPKDYAGFVIVLYNQSDGVGEKYNDDKRLYEIPASGILKTKFSAVYGRAEFP